MKNQEFAGAQVTTDAKLVLDMTETLPLLFSSAMRNKRFDGKWYQAIGFPSRKEVEQFLAIGWKWRELFTESDVIWLVHENDQGTAYTKADVIMG